MSWNNIIPWRVMELTFLEDKLVKAGIKVTDDMRPLDEYPHLQDLLDLAALEEVE